MRTDHHVKAYVDFLEKRADLRLPLKVVCDYSNGPVALVMRAFSPRLSMLLNVIPMNADIRPDFPAHGPDPSVPAALLTVGKKVVAERADLGVIFDGDGDRAVFVDEKGMPVPPSSVALFLMTNAPGTHVVDVLLYEAMTHHDPGLKARIIPSRVGRYFISRAMKEHDAIFGAEFSGHFFSRDFFGLDSAMINMILVLNLLSRMRDPASVIFSRYANHSVAAGKAGFSGEFDKIAQSVKERSFRGKEKVSEMDGLTIDFGDSWVNMRASNTEPVVRVTAGAADLAKAEGLVGDFKKMIAEVG